MSLYLIHFWSWENSPFPLLVLWGNKNWPLSMKVKKLEIFFNKKESTNRLDRIVSISHPPHKSLLFWKFSYFFTFILGGQFLLPQRANNGKGEFSQPQNWMRQGGLGSLGIQTGPFAVHVAHFVSESERCKGLQMVQFECPRHWKPSVSSTFGVGRIPFSHYWPSGVIRIGLPVWKWKSWKISRTKGV